MKKFMLLLFLLPLFSTRGISQENYVKTDDRTATFKFVLGQDMFCVTYGSNDVERNRLYSLVEEYRAEIASGKIPIHVGRLPRFATCLRRKFLYGGNSL
ncbi:MAG: hypothetical protein LBG19_05615 [Prevotellaceae bacterium]|nr:hypothetical protein [Prevotellaceae bacterium]